MSEQKAVIHQHFFLEGWMIVLEEVNLDALLLFCSI